MNPITNTQSYSQETASSFNGHPSIESVALDRPTAQENGFTVRGRVIDTGRYEIIVRKNKVLVKDRHTNTKFKVWGDPHLKTGDGDKAQFHDDNLTIDLEDGTKLTIKVTDMNKKGVSHIDSVAVTRGEHGVEAVGIHGRSKRLKIIDNLNGADLDKRYDDGTVMYAGHQVDDLFFAEDGQELVGRDRSQRFNEHQLDGRGGESRYSSYSLGTNEPIGIPEDQTPCDPDEPIRVPDNNDQTDMMEKFIDMLRDMLNAFSSMFNMVFPQSQDGNNNNPQSNTEVFACAEER